MTYYTQQPRGQKFQSNQSEARIVFIDGTETKMLVNAAPTVVPSLTKDMHNTGFLTLWNDEVTVCIRADQIKHFSMREAE
jgi:hypothetical protein